MTNRLYKLSKPPNISLPFTICIMEIVNFNLHGPQEKSESLMGSETSTQTIENLNLDQVLVDVKSNDESHHTLKPLATEKDTVSVSLIHPIIYFKSAYSLL